jgi:nucleoid-associated protein EbfC
MQDIRKLMKQAQQMQEQMAKVHEQLAQEEQEGTSGGGMVVVAMNGKYEVVSLKINPQVVDPSDVEMLEDLIAAAMNDARTKVEERTQSEMGKLTGGIGIPGMF